VLDSAGNNFGMVNATGGNLVEVHDVDSIDIGLITSTDTAKVVSGGSINDGGDGEVDFIAPKVILEAQSGIGAVGDMGNHLETETAYLELRNTTGEIGIVNTGDVFVEAMNTVGDIDFENTGDVTINEINADYDTGSLLMKVKGSVFGVFPEKTQYTQPYDIEAYNATIGVSGNFGTQQRLISVYVKNEFTLFSQTSAVYYPIQPKIINDQSDFKLQALDSLSNLSGQQLIEVESLAEIDPAIFTDVRNYYHEDLAIMMPDDQLYTEEEEERRRKLSGRQ